MVPKLYEVGFLLAMVGNTFSFVLSKRFVVMFREPAFDKGSYRRMAPNNNDSREGELEMGT